MKLFGLSIKNPLTSFQKFMPKRKHTKDVSKQKDKHYKDKKDSKYKRSTNNNNDNQTKSDVSKMITNNNDNKEGTNETSDDNTSNNNPKQDKQETQTMHSEVVSSEVVTPEVLSPKTLSPGVVSPGQRKTLHRYDTHRPYDVDVDEAMNNPNLSIKSEPLKNVDNNEIKTESVENVYDNESNTAEQSFATLWDNKRENDQTKFNVKDRSIHSLHTINEDQIPLMNLDLDNDTDSVQISRKYGNRPNTPSVNSVDESQTSMSQSSDEEEQIRPILGKIQHSVTPPMGLERQDKMVLRSTKSVANEITNIDGNVNTKSRQELPYDGHMMQKNISGVISNNPYQLEEIILILKNMEVKMDDMNSNILRQTHLINNLNVRISNIEKHNQVNNQVNKIQELTQEINMDNNVIDNSMELKDNSVYNINEGKPKLENSNQNNYINYIDYVYQTWEHIPHMSWTYNWILELEFFKSQIVW